MYGGYFSDRDALCECHSEFEIPFSVAAPSMLTACLYRSLNDNRLAYLPLGLFEQKNELVLL